MKTRSKIVHFKINGMEQHAEVMSENSINYYVKNSSGQWFWIGKDECWEEDI